MAYHPCGADRFGSLREAIKSGVNPRLLGYHVDRELHMAGGCHTKPYDTIGECPMLLAQVLPLALFILAAQ